VSAGRSLAEALEAERAALLAIRTGRPAIAHLVHARNAYLASHAESGRRSWGRLIGALKMAVLASDGAEAIARHALVETAEADGPAAAYARALAQSVLGQPVDDQALIAAGDAFARTGRALSALAVGDRGVYQDALAEILDDFAGRDEHLSGIPVADTALVLEKLADRHGLAVRPDHPLLPIY
jgi:hypothetical protein